MSIYIARFVNSSTVPAIDLTGFTQVFLDDFDGTEGDPPDSNKWWFFDEWGQGTRRDTVLTTTDAFLDGNSNLKLQARLVNNIVYCSFIQTYDWSVPESQWHVFGPEENDVYIEFRVKLDQFSAGGLWCAGWLFEPADTYDGNLLTGGEFDVWEYIISYGLTYTGSWTDGNSLNSFNTAIHWGQNSNQKVQLFTHNTDDGLPNLRDGDYHTFQAHWTKDKMVVYLDGIEVFRETTNVLRRDRHALQLSIEYDRGTPDQSDPDAWGIGEDATNYPSLFPSFILVDYVTVWTKPNPAIPDPPVIPNILIDGDWSGDVDGIGALCLAARAHQDGDCVLIGVGCGTWEFNEVQATDIILKYYGLDIPIGKQNVGVNGGITSDNITNHIVATFGTGSNKTVQEVPPTNTFYRTILAAAADNSVTFVTTGPLHNILALLQSPADSIDSRDGTTLFNTKVTQVFIMGGRYPGGQGVVEWNFGGGGAGNDIASIAIPLIAKPITFTPYEVGYDGSGYQCGSLWNSEADTNPVVYAYRWWFENPPDWYNGGVGSSTISDWGSWDIINTYIAIYGIGSYFTPITYGYNRINADGSNIWETNSDADHTYITAGSTPSSFITDVLNPLLLPSFLAKETSAPILTSTYGLTDLGFGDALGTSLDVGSPSHVFDPHTGGRNQQDPGVAERWSIVDFQGKRAVKSVLRANEPGILRYNSMWVNQTYDEFALRSNFWVPADFDMVSSNGTRIDGKSLYGLHCGGHIDSYNPNATTHDGLQDWEWRQGGNDQVNWPDEQWGCALGVNTYSRSYGNFELTTYLHALGGKRNGTDNIYCMRDNLYSILFNIQGWQTPTAYWDDGKLKPIGTGQWLRIEVYAKMDTNAMDGIFELWINGVLHAYAYGLDFGGFIGNRQTDLPGSNWTQRGSGVGGIAPYGGGWKFHAAFSRDMGRYTLNPTKENSYYGADWRFFGKNNIPTPPSTKTLNVDNNTNLLFWSASWQNNILNYPGQTVANAWTQAQHDPANLISQLSIIEDSTFGVMPLTGATAKVLQVRMWDPTGTPVDTSLGNRGELNGATDKNGSAIRYDANSPIRFFCRSFYIDDTAITWHNHTGWFTILQHHDTSAIVSPGDGGPFHLRLDSSRQLFLKVRGGINPTPADSDTITIPGAVPFNTWCHVIIEMHFSASSSSALARLYYRWEGTHTSWQTGPETNHPNRHIINGVADKPVQKMGIYRANEPTSIVNPYAVLMRGFLMIGSTFNSVVPYQEWLQSQE